MTFAQAFSALKETRTLSTELLRPLGIPFENFETLAATSNIEAFTARNQ